MTTKKQRINNTVNNLIDSILFKDKKASKKYCIRLMSEITFCKNQKMLLNY